MAHQQGFYQQNHSYQQASTNLNSEITNMHYRPNFSPRSPSNYQQGFALSSVADALTLDGRPYFNHQQRSTQESSGSSGSPVAESYRPRSWAVNNLNNTYPASPPTSLASSPPGHRSEYSSSWCAYVPLRVNGNSSLAPSRSFTDDRNSAHVPVNSYRNQTPQQQMINNARPQVPTGFDNNNIDPRILMPPPPVPEARVRRPAPLHEAAVALTPKIASPQVLINSRGKTPAAPAANTPMGASGANQARLARSYEDAWKYGAVEQPKPDDTKKAGQRCLTCIVNERRCEGRMVGTRCRDCYQRQGNCYWYDPRNGIFSYQDARARFLQKEQQTQGTALSQKPDLQNSIASVKASSAASKTGTVEKVAGSYQRGQAGLVNKPENYDPIKLLRNIDSERAQYFLKGAAAALVRSGDVDQDPSINIDRMGRKLHGLMKQINKDFPSSEEDHEHFTTLLRYLRDAAAARHPLQMSDLHTWAKEWERRYGSSTG